MRERLLSIVLPLMALLLVALETLLAQSYAARLSQDRFLELVADVESVAGSAAAPLRDGFGEQRLRQHLSKQAGVGTTVFVFDRDVTALAYSPAGAAVGEREADEARRAIAGGSPARPPTAWPWRTEPFVVGSRVGRDSPTVGAVVAVTSTADLRRSIAMVLAILLAAGLVVLALVTFAVVRPLVGWVLRPVGDLAAAAERIAAGQPDTRVCYGGGPAELRGLTAAFNRMAAAIDAALARQRAFAADASHQLRNPLTALRLRIDNLAPHLARSGQQELNAAREDADQLAETIDVLLRLACAEATTAELRVVDVAQTAVERISAWRPLFDERGIALRLSAPAGCYARCHPEAVEQALDAVLDNARKFGRATPVEVTVAAAPDEVRVRVRDHGLGLGDDERLSAGERFWRCPRHQNVEGTGLGLAIARTLLEGGGGRLELHDAGPGLAADVILPAPATSAPDGQPAASA